MASTSSWPSNTAKNSLIQRIQSDHPDLIFVDDEVFYHEPPLTIHLGPETDHRGLYILHELGHALLHHRDYRLDIDLLQMETLAWVEAKRLANLYGIKYNQDFAEERLDTYRDWLHARSTCPICNMNGYQVKSPQREYHCPNCLSSWRVPHTNRMRITKFVK
jgi:hypothetical protein